MSDDTQHQPCVTEIDDQRIQQGYRAMFERHGVAPESLGWRDTSQVVRFEAVRQSLAVPQPESLVDLGCGFGDLLGFLRKRGWTGSYVGVDVMPEFIQEARSRHGHDPGASFTHGHVLTADLPQKGFDACVAIGLCNAHRVAGNRAFIEALTTRAVSLARRTVLIDFLSRTSDRRRKDLFFFDPEDAVATGLKHSRRVIIDHSYMPFEFILKIRLDDEVMPQLPYFATAT